MRIKRCVYKKHGAFYYVKKGKWHYLTKEESDIDRQLFIKHGIPEGDLPLGNLDRASSPLTDYLLKVFRRARQNARGRRKISFSLSEEDVMGLLEDCNYRCAVTGTPFSIDKDEKSGKRPFAPSIDRIDSDLGYEKANCRIVCVAANYAMNAWGDEVLLRMLRYARKSKKPRKRAKVLDMS